MTEYKLKLRYVCDDCGIVLSEKVITETEFQFWCNAADGTMSDCVEVRGNTVVRVTYCRECYEYEMERGM